MEGTIFNQQIYEGRLKSSWTGSS